MKIRVGHGFDVHALVPGRALILGGVKIPSARGLLGHSDADVLLHAIADAILGAAALGDIGHLFPDSDAAYKNADSRLLLQHAAQRVRDAGWRIENIDATVVAEQPRIAPHTTAMCQNIAAACEIAANAVSVKGKSTEKLGFTGRGEGIAAMAVALLVSD
ncbi:MAG TPA: 2-C-methyl-D-erythritol 2,4-cyclodiphosphate synthase [Burkholderiaceae bacterium]|nr:2-C-methyl-D-erythritol 2,4-cyclodiphosphate synthase [Burkholderiaceae bacterium]